MSATHLMISHAAGLGEAAAAAASQLELPQLGALLARLVPEAAIGSDEYSPDTPLEAGLAASWGWQADAGCLPFAAALAEDDGVAVGDAAWALLTPLHMAVGSDQVTAFNPQALALGEAESRDFFEALAWLFPAEEGWRRAWGAPLRWYVAHDSLDGLACASAERIINRSVDPWMPEPRRLRTLQNEIQMLLHRLPANASREAHGALALNSVWISGCGRAQGRATDATLQLETGLREPLLNEDWAGWSEAWQALDAGPVAALLARARAGEAVQLTLCGERLARRWRVRPSGGLSGGLSGIWRRMLPARSDLAATLGAL